MADFKAELQSLPQVKDRMTFIYLEHCKLSRDNNAVTVIDNDGIVHIPAAGISVLLLGPGTDITHRAVELIGDMGVTLIWVGEKGVRYYAGGRPLTHRSTLLIKQAEMVTNQRKHAEVVRKMYAIRFPNEDVSKLTVQQLRGREGARVRATYKEASKKWNVPWNGREYDPDDFSASDPVNQSLSAGNVCLYGLAHAVIIALGCSAGLGFVHVGHDKSFAYDIADLYKAEITIPLAFEFAATIPKDEIASVTRHRVRDSMTSAHILERMVKDIKYLLSDDENVNSTEDVVYLWDNKLGTVKNGISYGSDYEED